MLLLLVLFLGGRCGLTFPEGSDRGSVVESTHLPIELLSQPSLHCIEDARLMTAAVQFLSTKIGTVIVGLGAMHFFDMRMLVHFRQSATFGRLAAA
jgi:hypothetical protein